MEEDLLWSAVRGPARPPCLDAQSMTSVPALSPQAQPLIRLEVDASVLASNWAHCDQLANYLARLAAFDRADSFLYANLLSTVLNELLEIIFVQHTPPGQIVCSLWRDGTFDRIELEIPADGTARDFYLSGVAKAQAPEVDETYTHLLLGDGQTDRIVGFLELAADYDARISLEPFAQTNTLRLVVDVELEAPAASAQAPVPTP